MPNGQPAQLANLRPPFQRGNTINRHHKNKEKAISKACLVSPEMVDYAVSVVRDVGEPTALRLRACLAILDKAISINSTALEDKVADRLEFLKVIFVRPDERNEVEAKPNGNGSFSVSFDGDG